MKKENGKREINKKTGISFIVLIVFIALAVTSINACGYLGIFGELSWKEEVLLHDGSKIIVQRWQKRMNVYTLEKSTLLKEQSLSFKHPKTREKIAWKDGPTEGIRTANFKLVALHIKDNIPYIITTTYGCPAYNKWGRPNPPYVIFKYENKQWKRIPLEELPPEFKNVNLVMSVEKREIQAGPSLISAEMVKKSNDRFHRPLFRSIVRTPMEGVGCEELVYDGRGGWSGTHFFKTKPSYEACVDECKKTLFDMKYCPCDRFFKEKSKGE
jgi:hypothetical protein